MQFKNKMGVLEANGVNNQRNMPAEDMFGGIYETAL
jgi:hypothetical protein